MPLSREQILTAIKSALATKGGKKFTQSVELVINFRGINFSKAENRLNLEIILPKGKGREKGLAAFADGALAQDAKRAGVETIIAGDEIPKLAADKPRLKALAKSADFIAAPALMMLVGKHLGQYLGTKDKLPKPVMGGSLADIAARLKKTVRLKSKGKYLPTVQCLVGTESMPAEDLTDNVEAVYEAVRAKVTDQGIRSIYVKLTMGAPVRII